MRFPSPCIECIWVRAVSSVHPVPLNSVNISQKIKINRPHTKTVSPHAWRKWIGWHPTVQIFFFSQGTVVIDIRWKYLWISCLSAATIMQMFICLYFATFLCLLDCYFTNYFHWSSRQGLLAIVESYLYHVFLIISAQFKNEVAMINSQLFS